MFASILGLLGIHILVLGSLGIVRNLSHDMGGWLPPKFVCHIYQHILQGQQIVGESIVTGLF